VQSDTLGTELQAVYTGFEAVTTRILKADGISYNKSESNHKDLLNAVVSNGLLTDDSSVSVFTDILRFRHVVRKFLRC